MATESLDPDPTSRARLSQGDIIGARYRVVRLLGRGGIGAVYEAVNTWTSRNVAIKLLQDGEGADDDLIARFKREAQAASKLRHPNIVDVLDMGPEPTYGGAFIAQELLSGRDLRAHLEERGALGVAETFELMIPVMGALSAAHSLGILHRDVKPENIFLTDDGGGGVTPKLIDFGLAKFVDDHAARHAKTRTGAMLGTPAYMSPEQFEDTSSTDARSDIWAVGVVLYELLSGQVPFDGSNVMVILWKVAHGDMKPLREVAPSVPEDVAELVHAALRVDRSQRPSSMRAWLDDFMRCPSLTAQQGEPLRVRHRASIRDTDVDARADCATAVTLQSIPAPTPAPSEPTGVQRTLDDPEEGEAPPAAARRSRVLAAVGLGVALTAGAIAARFVVTATAARRIEQTAPAERRAPSAVAPLSDASAQPPPTELPAQPPVAPPPAASAPTTPPIAAIDTPAHAPGTDRASDVRRHRRPRTPRAENAPSPTTHAAPATTPGYDPDRLLTP